MAYQRNLQLTVATAATGVDFLNGAHTTEVQHPTVESRLCAPRGAVCPNDPCKSISVVFGLQRRSICAYARWPQLTPLFKAHGSMVLQLQLL